MLQYPEFYLRLVPGALDHGALVPWCMVHEPIPWVLVALDPGTWCLGSWIMGQYPGFWLRLVPGIFSGVVNKSLF